MMVGSSRYATPVSELVRCTMYRTCRSQCLTAPAVLKKAFENLRYFSSSVLPRISLASSLKLAGGYGTGTPAAHDTYCAKPPDHGHMLPSISTAVMSRFAISASRKSSPATTASLYAHGDGCIDGRIRHGVERSGCQGSRSGPSLAASTRMLPIPSACSRSSSRSSRGRSPPTAPAAPRCIAYHMLAPTKRYGSPKR